MPVTTFICRTCGATPQKKYLLLQLDRQMDIHDYLAKCERAARVNVLLTGGTRQQASEAATRARGEGIAKIQRLGEAEGNEARKQRAFDAATNEVNQAQRPVTELRSKPQPLDGDDTRALGEALRVLGQKKDAAALAKAELDEAKRGTQARYGEAMVAEVIDPTKELGGWPCEHCGSRQYLALSSRALARPMRVPRRAQRRVEAPPVVDRSQRPTHISVAIYSGSYYADDTATIAQRVQLFDDAIAKAAAGEEGGPALLNGCRGQKIFIGPEFFFTTNPGQNGGSWYLTHDQKKDCFTKLKELSAKYADWLIAAGTICYIDDAAPADKGIYNAMPLFFNGELLAVHVKKSMPGDELKILSTHPGWVCKTTYEEEGEDGEWSSRLDVRGGILNWKGITFGLEICNDVRVGVFRRAYERIHKKAPPVDVMLISAAGLGMNQDLKGYFGQLRASWPPAWGAQDDSLVGHRNLRLRRGGYVVYCDAARLEKFNQDMAEGRLDRGAGMFKDTTNDEDEPHNANAADLQARKLCTVFTKTVEDEVVAALDPVVAGRSVLYLGKRPNTQPAIFHYLSAFKDLALPV